MIDLIQQLNEGKDLGRPDVRRAVEALLDEGISGETKGEFLVALRTKGESAEEIAAFAEAFLQHAVDPGLRASSLTGPLIDMCGTGGDRLDLFNISTAASFVLAAGGACVAKHGNRGVTSKCGGADVLEALGVRIDLPPATAARALEQAGICFLFAPLFHPAFKVVAPIRRELASRGHPTVFNLLGPLLNPARPPRQLTGVFSRDWIEKYARVMGCLGRERAWALNGGGADELTPVTPAHVCEWSDGSVRPFTVDPVGLGLAPTTFDALKGGDRETNARLLLDLLSGQETGPKRDAVAMNAAAGFVVAGIEPDLGYGLERALRILAGNAALRRLEALREIGD